VRGKRLIAAFVTLGLLAAMGGAGTYVLNSERGLRWAFAIAARAVPGELHAAQLHGRLLGPIEAEGLVYDGPGAKLAIANASLDWRPRDLLSGHVHITRLHLSGLTVTPKTKGGAPRSARRAPPGLVLPVAVTLDDARIEDLRVQQANAAGAPTTSVTVERIELNAEADAKRIRIDTLRAVAATWSFTINGDIAPKPPYRAQLRTQWQVQPPGRAAIEGSGQLRGNVQRLQIHQALNKPFGAQLQAALTNVLSKPHWQGRLQFKAAKLRDLVPGARPVTLGGEAHGKGTLARFEASANVTAHDAEFGPVDASLTLHRSGERWLLDRLQASTPDAPTQLSAHGHLDHGAGDRFALEAQWQSLRWPLRGPATIESGKGSASVQGTLAQYQVSLSAGLSADGTALGNWQAKGDGDRHALRLIALTGDPLGGQVQGRGRLAWGPKPSWSVNLIGRGLDPGKRWEEWPGKIDFALEHSGGMNAGRLDTDTRLTHLGGELRGEPLRGSLALRTQGPDLELSRAELAQGKAQLTASGSVAHRWSLQWSLKAPDLAAVLPDAQGAVNATGQLSGPRERPSLALHLDADKLSWHDYGAAQAKAEGTVDLGDTRPSELHVDIAHLRLPGRAVDSLHLDASGRASDHRVTLAAKSGQTDLSLGIEGALVPNQSGVQSGDQWQWHGHLARLEFRSQAFGQWALGQAGEITASRSGIDIAQNCLTASPARLCLQGGWGRSGGWRGAVEARRLPLALLDPWLPPGVYLSGSSDATAQLATSKQSRQAELQLKLSPGSLMYAPNGGQMQAAPFRDGQLSIKTVDGALQGRLQLGLGQGGQLQGELKLPRFGDPRTPLAAQPVDATVEARQVGLQWLPAAFPELTKASGELHGRVSIGGTLGSPSLHGELAVDQGSVEIPRLGLHLQRITLSVRNSAAERLAFEGQVTSGDGTLKLSGQADTNVLQGGSAKLTLEGEKITVADIPEAKVVASPKLALRVDNYQAHLSGEVRVPQARLEPGKYKPPVSASPDVVIVGAQQSREPRTRWRLHTRVKIELGEAVSFQGFGLSGKLGGGLLAIDEPGQATIGEGEIRVTEGKYKIYGRELTVEQGRLLFPGGPITNPNVDARAVRKIGDITAGVRVQGPLKSPQVSLYSDPSMDESDILSYLVVGRPLNAASKSEGNLVYAAATSLGLQGGGLIAKRIGTMFGIQDVQITSQQSTQTGVQQPALLLGTYLSPRIYVAYTVGLFEPSQVLQFRFHLTPHWELRTESGSASSGADLLFSIER